MNTNKLSDCEEINKPTFLEDKDYILNKAAWIEIKGFAIRIRATDLGVAVDIYQSKKEENGAITSAFVFDSDLDSETDEE
jgi:hypothetical protein